MFYTLHVDHIYVYGGVCVCVCVCLCEYVQRDLEYDSFGQGKTILVRPKSRKIQVTYYMYCEVCFSI